MNASGGVVLTDLVTADDAASAEVVTAEVLVGGQPLIDKTPCEHRSTHLSQVTVATIEAPDGTVDRFEAQIEVMCSGCTASFDVDPIGRKPRDGRPGIVVTLTPKEIP